VTPTAPPFLATASSVAEPATAPNAIMNFQAAFAQVFEEENKAEAAPEVRVLCLHGALLHKDILQLSLVALKKAAQKQGLELNLIYENGPRAMPMAEAQVFLDKPTRAMLAKQEFLYSWAVNDDSAAHGGREYPDMDDALAFVQSLLKKHAPVHGLLGMSQGGNLAQVVAAQSSNGIGAPLKFTMHFGGAKPGWQHQKPELFASPIATPAFICGGLTDVTDGSHADPGMGQMAALVHPLVLEHKTHADGHRPFPIDREAAAAQADKMCAFIKRAMDEGGFPPPPLPPPEPPTKAAASAAAAAAVDVSDDVDGHGGGGGHGAAAGDRSLASFLQDVGLAHLGALFGDVRLDDATAALAGGRTTYLADLKRRGVEKLSERQAIANQLAKAVREGKVEGV
jgi:hypothetical protein